MKDETWIRLGWGAIIAGAIQISYGLALMAFGCCLIYWTRYHRAQEIRSLVSENALQRAKQARDQIRQRAAERAARESQREPKH